MESRVHREVPARFGREWFHWGRLPHEFAEYRATKHFSDTLINKIAKDEYIRNYNNYEHEMEILRHAMASVLYR